MTDYTCDYIFVILKVVDNILKNLNLIKYR